MVMHLIWMVFDPAQSSPCAWGRQCASFRGRSRANRCLLS